MDNSIRTYIKDFKQGDSDAFESIYNLYAKKIYNFSRLYVDNKQDAEEVVHDVFIRIWEKRELIDENLDFNNFLLVIARNIIFGSFRKKVNEEAYKVSLQIQNEAFEDMESQIEADDLKAFIDLLIEEMPEKRKLVFKMSREQMKSQKEIASELDLSERTVERHIYQALKYLKENLFIMVLLS